MLACGGTVIDTIYNAVGLWEGATHNRRGAAA